VTNPEHERQDGGEPRVVVRDRRRIDPQTGQVRTPGADEASGAGAESGGRHAKPESEPTGRHAAPEDGAPQAETEAVAPELARQLEELQRQLDERTADLQRVTAEFANYRRRVERDRELIITTAKANLAGELLAVLDDLERAEAHGDLTGAFKAVADKLLDTLRREGLEPFGAEGEPFDPTVHEAVQHNTSPDVDGPTITLVLRRGYRFGDRVLRPALVGVTDHEPGAAPPQESADGQGSADA